MLYIYIMRLSTYLNTYLDISSFNLVVWYLDLYLGLIYPGPGEGLGGYSISAAVITGNVEWGNGGMGYASWCGGV